jgi:PAS domain-containing protein
VIATFPSGQEASIPDPLVELSAAGEILAIHSAHRGPFHLPEQSEERRRLEDVLSPTAATMRAALALAAAVAAAVADGRSPRQQIEVAKPGGVDWFELSIARRGPPNGDGHRYLMFCRDITERKRKEAGGFCASTGSTPP